MPLYPEKEIVQLQPAFILHHKPYRNTSLLLDVLSQDFGRLSLIAKGAQRPKSNLRSCLQPFQRLSISWVRKTELGTLTQAEFSEKPINIQGEAMYAAMYLNELLTRLLTRGDHIQDIFHSYSHSLKCLQDSDIAPVLRIFEYNLLQSLGFEMQLAYDVDHHPIQAACTYKYVPEQGFVLSQEKNITLFQGEHLIAFNESKFDSPEVLKTAQLLMQSGLNKLLGAEPLKSRELFRAFRKLNHYKPGG